jgi:hypothetical protein
MEWVWRENCPKVNLMVSLGIELGTEKYFQILIIWLFFIFCLALSLAKLLFQICLPGQLMTKNNSLNHSIPKPRFLFTKLRVGMRFYLFPLARL